MVTCPELLYWLLATPRGPYSGGFRSSRGGLTLPSSVTSCRVLPKPGPHGSRNTRTLASRRGECWTANCSPDLTYGAVVLVSSLPCPTLLPEPRHPAPQAPSSSSLSPLQSNPFLSTNLLKDKYQALLGDKHLRPYFIFLISKQHDLFYPICIQKVGKRDISCPNHTGKKTELTQGEEFVQGRLQVSRMQDKTLSL